jgi:hypothetical protein
MPISHFLCFLPHDFAKAKSCQSGHFPAKNRPDMDVQTNFGEARSNASGVILQRLRQRHFHFGLEQERPHVTKWEWRRRKSQNLIHSEILCFPHLPHATTEAHQSLMILLELIVHWEGHDSLSFVLRALQPTLILVHPSLPLPLPVVIHPCLNYTLTSLHRVYQTPTASTEHLSSLTLFTGMLAGGRTLAEDHGRPHQRVADSDRKNAGE